MKGLAEGRPVKLGSEEYANRIVAFVQSAATSDTYAKVVGSHVRFLADRLHAVREGAQKGSHSVTTRQEAEAYVLYTYLLLGDVLSLRESIVLTADRIPASDGTAA